MQRFVILYNNLLFSQFHFYISEILYGKCYENVFLNEMARNVKNVNMGPRSTNVSWCWRRDWERHLAVFHSQSLPCWTSFTCLHQDDNKPCQSLLACSAPPTLDWTRGGGGVTRYVPALISRSHSLWYKTWNSTDEPTFAGIFDLVSFIFFQRTRLTPWKETVRTLSLS